MKKSIPELPIDRLARYVDEIGIPTKQAAVLVKQKQLGDLFDAVVVKSSDSKVPRLAANYLTSDVLQYVEDSAETLFARVTAEAFAELIAMLIADELSSRGAKDIIALLVKEGGMPRSLAERERLFQQSDAGALQGVLEKVLQEHASVAEEYRSGKEQALQFLVGQVMKETKGSSNPAKVQEMLKEILS